MELFTDLTSSLPGQAVADLVRTEHPSRAVPHGVTPGSARKPGPVRGAHTRERSVGIAGIQEPKPVTGLHLLVQPVRYVGPCFDARVSLYQHPVDEVHAGRIDSGLKLLAELPDDRAHHAGHLLRYRPSRVTCLQTYSKPGTISLVGPDGLTKVPNPDAGPEFESAAQRHVTRRPSAPSRETLAVLMPANAGAFGGAGRTRAARRGAGRGDRDHRRSRRV